MSKSVAGLHEKTDKLLEEDIPTPQPEHHRQRLEGPCQGLERHHHGQDEKKPLEASPGVIPASQVDGRLHVVGGGRGANAQPRKGDVSVVGLRRAAWVVRLGTPERQRFS